MANSFQLSFFLLNSIKENKLQRAMFVPSYATQIFYILIQFKSFRFAQGYCGWWKSKAVRNYWIWHTQDTYVNTTYNTQDFYRRCMSYNHIARCILHTNKTYLNRNLHSFSFVEKLYRDTNITHDIMRWIVLVHRQIMLSTYCFAIFCSIVVSTTPPPYKPYWLIYNVVMLAGSLASFDLFYQSVW